MDSGRFLKFIDAILAIMMTVMVLKIPQPEAMTFAGIMDLKILYFAYFVSFIVIFSIWDHHRKLFSLIEEIDNQVIWTYSMLIFFITLLPYFTAWVAHEPYDVLPELMFGLLFLIINILYIISTSIAIRNDVHNDLINDLNYNELIIINVLLFAIGIVSIFIGYPISMLIICLITLITWNIIPAIKKTYHIGDNNGN